MLHVPVTLARVAIGYLIGRVISAFGLGVLSYTSISNALTFIQDEIASIVNDIFPTTLIHMLGLVHFDMAVNLIFSAYLGVVAFQSLRWAVGRTN